MAAGSMSKIAINNEIVLMRQAVRKSRVAVVRKLIKEAKLLQARKHGDEKVQEKCKRKAKRLLDEIAAVKKLKDDEISKFAITNTRKLQEVLNDTSAEPAARVMTRLTFHKTLGDRINKFKDKFPEYEQHLGPGRKKLSKIQRRTDREARNALRKSVITGEANGAISHATEEPVNRIGDESVNEESEESSNEDDEMNSDSEGEIEPVADSEIEEDVADQLGDSIVAEHGLEPDSALKIQTPSSTRKKRKIDEVPFEIETVDSVSVTSLEAVPREKSKTKLKTTKGAKKIEIKASAEPKKPKIIKVVSKEATVKRFTDLMDDKEPEERIEAAEIGTSSKKRDIKSEKEVDPFFVAQNGVYWTDVRPKSAKLSENVEEDESEPKYIYERKNRFVSKVDQRANGSYGDKFGRNTGGRQRHNDFGNGPPKKFEKNSNGPARPPRNVRPEFEKKCEPKDETLHPSWAARKKQQEILKQGFQGKKIVFDD